MTRYVRTVLWSFFGVSRRDALDQGQAPVTPLGLLATALGLVALFGLALWGLVQAALAILG